MKARPQRRRFFWHWMLPGWLLTGCGGGGGDKLSPLEEQIYLAPTAVATTLSFDRVAQGCDSSCMLTPGGEAWCWGNNENGQLGAPTAKSCQSGLVLKAGGTATCAIRLAGSPMCWGLNSNGAVGQNNLGP